MGIAWAWIVLRYTRHKNLFVAGLGTIILVREVLAIVGFETVAVGSGVTIPRSDSCHVFSSFCFQFSSYA
jgi:hypothetical protein